MSFLKAKAHTNAHIARENCFGAGFKRWLQEYYFIFKGGDGFDRISVGAEERARGA